MALEGCVETVRLAGGFEGMAFEEIAEGVVGVVFFPRKFGIIVNLRIVRHKRRSWTASQGVHQIVAP